MQEDWHLAQEQLKLDIEDLQQSQHSALIFEEQVQQCKLEFCKKERQCQESQKLQSQWEIHWQELQTVSHTIKRELELARVNAQHQEERRCQTALRVEQLTAEQKSTAQADLQDIKINLDEKYLQLKKTQDFDEECLGQSNEIVTQLRCQLKETELQLHQLQDDFHHLNNEYAALIAAQRAAKQGIKKDKEIIKEWFDKPRLMDVLKVEPRWHGVCEMVLNETLHAYVLETLDDLWPQWESCVHQGESVVTLRPSQSKQQSYPRLADKIQGTIPATVYHLDMIYTAEDLNEALRWLPSLSDQESVVTANGFWLGKGWVKLANSEELDELGLLARQQKIADLRGVVDDLKTKTESVRTQRDQYHAQLQYRLKDTERFQLTLNASNEALRININAQSANEQAIFQAQRLVASMALEGEQLQRILVEAAVEQLTMTETVRYLEIQFSEYEQKQEQLICEKQSWIDSLAVFHQQLETVRRAVHQAELEYDRELTKIHLLTTRINREQERLEVLKDRLEHCAFLCLKSIEPGAELKEQRKKYLMNYAIVELQLTDSREQLSQLRMDLEALESSTMHYDLETKRMQEVIGQARLQEQELAVRASSVQDSLKELGLQAQILLLDTAVGMTQSMLEDELMALCDQIKRLGAINLAAIEEYATEQLRKLYLDEQCDDLNQALAILETAIEQMDKETRLRFEHTFNAVNTAFKALFPRLFGGGKAQLELTCDDLLEAGIVVMAQPPGKRNSTIHLLSGGEKAMTAVALVFAIFQLNPSPFCMLDEVDAPLDDVNVGRFCDLVKEMSQFVQFLFITHNKVTMELADHLIGVTMREPGVSRLVTVDVKQVLSME